MIPCIYTDNIYIQIKLVIILPHRVHQKWVPFHKHMGFDNFGLWSLWWGSLAHTPENIKTWLSFIMHIKIWLNLWWGFIIPSSNLFFVGSRSNKLRIWLETWRFINGSRPFSFPVNQRNGKISVVFFFFFFTVRYLGDVDPSNPDNSFNMLNFFLCLLSKENANNQFIRVRRTN